MREQKSIEMARKLREPTGPAQPRAPRNGSERAAKRLAAKAKANAEFYRDTPSSPISRQVQRARDRANNYWTVNRWGRLEAGRPRSCRLIDAIGRDHVSRNAIAAQAVRERLSPRPAPLHPKGMKHAWQRKAAAVAALRALIDQAEAA